jgi:hypothetical protein
MATLKKIIAQQKTIARKSIAYAKLLSGDSQYTRANSNDKQFLKYNFGKVATLDELMNVIHTIRHNGLNKAGKYKRCTLCKNILASIIDLDEKPIDILPKFGNLLAILEQEVNEENNNLSRKHLPSQNDLTRWALKNAVLAYYKNLNVPVDKPIIESRFDDRLVTELAPDFDVIAKIWIEKLDELKRRDDRYSLNMDEFDKAEADLKEAMRGSAFEKQLDRYREEWMAKLPR